MKKIKRSKPKKLAPNYGVYVCLGCGYEYKPDEGDEEGEISPGTLFEQLPEDWTCPQCAKEKEFFIREEFPQERQ